MSKRSCGIKGCKYKTSSWHSNDSPLTVTLGQQYNIGEKPTVILYTYINRHAGTPEKQRRRKSTLSNMVEIIYCYIGCDDKVTTLKREHRGPRCRHPHNPESTRHRYSPGSRRRAVEEVSQVGMVPTYDVRSTATK